MTAFRRNNVQCLSPSGLHRVSYLEWGERDNPRVLVCAHGLTRCARDFDFLAAEMAKTHRVICPDVAGRGESQWLRNPMEYVVPTYVADMVTLIARLDVESVQWVGTSLGGLIGMALAAFPEGLVSRLVLNDSGPLVTAASLDRIVCDWTQCDLRRAARTRAIRHDGNADRERDQHDNRKSVHEAPG